jgi:hypothetical protein
LIDTIGAYDPILMMLGLTFAALPPKPNKKNSNKAERYSDLPVISKIPSTSLLAELKTDNKEYLALKRRLCRGFQLKHKRIVNYSGLDPVGSSIAATKSAPCG